MQTRLFPVLRQSRESESAANGLQSFRHLARRGLLTEADVLPQNVEIFLIVLCDFFRWAWQ